jgi:PIN domain nuclease of toxin-antitoxin system
MECIAVILLDTHIWIWWVSENDRLSQKHAEIIEANIDAGIGVSIISCWEVAKLVEYDRLRLIQPVDQWIRDALAYPGVQLLELTPPIVIESTQLPGNFHKDPADQMIVATARIYNISLLTVDSKIVNYPHVQKPSEERAES